MNVNGGGYTFISPNDLLQLTGVEIQAMFTDTTSVLWRVLYMNGTQKYGVLEQLPIYRYTRIIELGAFTNVFSLNYLKPSLYSSIL
jgi:hypothetical protein